MSVTSNKKAGPKGPRRQNQKRRPRRPQNNGRPGQRRREFTKMPRRQTKPTLWERFLRIFGLDPFQEKPRKKASAKASPEPGKPPAKAAAGEPAKKRTRRERPKRLPEMVAVTSGRLYVGNLSYDATESDLHQLFNGVGIVESAEVVCHRKTQRSKGYAFVELQSVDQAKRAVDELHDKEYMGRKLVISGAKAPQGERGAA